MSVCLLNLTSAQFNVINKPLSCSILSNVILFRIFELLWFWCRWFDIAAFHDDTFVFVNVRVTHLILSLTAKFVVIQCRQSLLWHFLSAIFLSHYPCRCNAAKMNFSSTQNANRIVLRHTIGCRNRRDAVSHTMSRFSLLVFDSCRIWFWCWWFDIAAFHDDTFVFVNVRVMQNVYQRRVLQTDVGGIVILKRPWLKKNNHQFRCPWNVYERLLMLSCG